MRYLGSTISEKFQGLLMDNYVKEKRGRIIRLSKRIYEKNVVIRMASNDAAEILVLLSKMGESANIKLRVTVTVIKENEKDKKDYGME
ncbi:hypothetical protein C1645_826659 [Glomus cerebriforme]|uniref:Uncharacterized protein n=1 Tax=Glomus cerebriforme TaxID=658196 RepID=A0A397SW53_9GLOM|nr:hypothetical protein C1645_826659 [Glomus cerebriforme]